MTATQKVILLVLGVIALLAVTAVAVHNYLEQQDQPAVVIEPFEVESSEPIESAVNGLTVPEAPGASDAPDAPDAPDEQNAHREASLNDSGDDAAAVEQTAQTAERTIRVATWNPLDMDAPDWIVPAVNKLRDNRRRFSWYQGNYKRYTADLITQINWFYDEGEPVTLILQGWFNMRNVGGDRPQGIDPHGLFTHADDRLASGLPGIWPNAGKEFWSRATDHLLHELKAAGIDVEFFAFDTEVWPHRHNPPFAFEEIFQEIIADPRWETEPLAGFGGLTGADIWPDPPVHNFNQMNWLIRRIGEHSFATIKNEVFTSRVLSYYPNVLVSDYSDFSRWIDPKQETDSVRRRAAEAITHATGQSPWFRAGMGNVASPTYYGQGRYHEEGRSRLDVMLEHAATLVDLYGADRVAPWITNRQRTDNGIDGQEITEEEYREWIQALVDLGIERFIWWPGGGGTSHEEQALTVNAFKAAAGKSTKN